MNRVLTIEMIKEWEKDANSDRKLTELAELGSAYSDGTYPFINNDVKQAFASHIYQTWEIATNTIRLHQLQFLRIILRDKENSDKDFYVPILALLTRVAALLNEEDKEYIFMATKVVLEVEKCLINLLFNSLKARTNFQKTAFERLISRIWVVSDVYGGVRTIYEGHEFLNEWTVGEIEELLLYDLKIAFITTALMREFQNECINDTDKTMTFIKMVQYSLEKMCSNKEISKEFLPNNIDWKYANEALKALFNFYHSAKIFDLEIAKKCAEQCALIVQNTSLDMETKQNAVNLLAVMPSTLPTLCPKVESKSRTKVDKSLMLEGYDMHFVDALLKTFEQRVDNYEKEQTSVEFLGTFFTAFNYLCTEHKAARRYCRMKIIPPLKAEHVERRPEVGDDFRNKIVRLMMGTSRCSELASEFLFVLCKRSVGRLIKYCGFGHSAGLLANYGFLGQAASARHLSDSEDSGTEEYKEVENKINPVTGSIPPSDQIEEWRRQLDSMSDEQKEYEMMKLINCMDKLMDQGVIAPGKIGEDGRPRQLQHVAELIKDTKEESKESDSD